MPPEISFANIKALIFGTPDNSTSSSTAESRITTTLLEQPGVSLNELAAFKNYAPYTPEADEETSVLASHDFEDVIYSDVDYRVQYLTRRGDGYKYLVTLSEADAEA